MGRIARGPRQYSAQKEHHVVIYSQYYLVQSIPPFERAIKVTTGSVLDLLLLVNYRNQAKACAIPYFHIPQSNYNYHYKIFLPQYIITQTTTYVPFSTNGKKKVM